MKPPSWLGLIGLAGLVLEAPGCWRADLHIITKASTMDARSQDPGAADAERDAITCPSPSLPVGNTNRTLQVGTQSRTYVLRVPASYDGSKPSPLLLDFHAIGRSGSYELANSPYPAVADRDGVIMAFPDGLRGPAGTGWNVGSCCVPADVDDLAFARALVSDVRATACIDPGRIYAVGLATGGGMAYALACHAAELFAAVSSSSFDLVQEDVGDCLPSPAVTVVSFRGTGETKVPYGGGLSTLVAGMPITFLGAEATFKKWAELDGCASSPSGANSDGCSAYATCQDDAEVVLCTKQGGGEEFGDASIAWSVLRRHTRKP
jgi:polyhydroxybutyrate depolymerase